MDVLYSERSTTTVSNYVLPGDVTLVFYLGQVFSEKGLKTIVLSWQKMFGSFHTQYCAAGRLKKVFKRLTSSGSSNDISLGTSLEPSPLHCEE